MNSVCSKDKERQRTLKANCGIRCTGKNESESQSWSQREVGETGANPGEIQLHMAELSFGYSQANAQGILYSTLFISIKQPPHRPITN